jgi:signal transduction histidine kinase
LHVRDHGAGFPADLLPHAFERFSPPDDSRTGHDAGLGLCIGQATALTHGGSASVSNPDGGGADVWLTLPHQPPQIDEGGPRSVDACQRARSFLLALAT